MQDLNSILAYLESKHTFIHRILAAGAASPFSSVLGTRLECALIVLAIYTAKESYSPSVLLRELR